MYKQVTKIKDFFFNKIYGKKFFLFLLVLILAFIAWSSVTLQNIIADVALLFDKYTGENILVGMGIFLGLAAASTMLTMFSSIPIIPIAALLWGASTTFLLLFFGWLIGSVISYFFARYAGYPLVAKIISKEKIAAYEEKFSKKTPFGVVLLFRLILPAEIPNYLLGIIRYPFGKYFLATFISEIPFALIAAYSGAAFVEQNASKFTLWIILGVALLTLLVILFKRKLKRLE